MLGLAAVLLTYIRLKIIQAIISAIYIQERLRSPPTLFDRDAASQTAEASPSTTQLCSLASRRDPYSDGDDRGFSRGPGERTGATDCSACSAAYTCAVTHHCLEAILSPSAAHLPHHTYLQLRALQKEHEKLQHSLAVRDHEIAALREIAEAAGQLQSQDTQAAKVGRASLTLFVSTSIALVSDPL
jgi:hypothetical protein